MLRQVRVISDFESSQVLLADDSSRGHDDRRDLQAGPGPQATTRNCLGHVFVPKSAAIAARLTEFDLVSQVVFIT